MGLRRSHLVPPRDRREASWWTSVGLTAIGLLGIALIDISGRPLARDSALRWHSSSTRSSSDDPSRLLQSDWMYPDDPLLEERGDPVYSKARNKEWLVLHVFLMGYMILGLNTVCDIYFTSALDVMVDRWKIKPDVAGATFMAAGGSAPELFTSLIGAVISQSDVGFGTIVGSAVFNVLFVIGMCGLAATTPIALTWWPLLRDCTYYIFGLSLLALFARTDKGIEWWEALTLFIGYLIYCVLMYFNEFLESKVKREVVEPLKEDDGPSHVIQVTDCEDEQARMGTKDKTLRQAGSIEPVPGPPEHHIGRTENSIIGHTENSTGEISSSGATTSASIQACQPGASNSPRDHKHHIRKPYFDREHAHNSHPNYPDHPSDGGPQGKKLSSNSTTSRGSEGDATSSKTSKPSITLGGLKKGVTDEVADSKAVAVDPADMADDEEESEEPDDIEEMMTRPEDHKELLMWILKLPVYVPLYYLTPKPTARCFIATFFASLLWIAGFSFFLVWWIEILCNVVEIDSIVAGLTVLAASTSIPDLVSSMAVARAGEGDMAVSSSIGSNIFDIMVGLPIPWMIKILIVEGASKGNMGYKVKIDSPFIVLYVLLLLFMVFCVIVSIHILKWRLTRALGVCMAALYAIFLTVALTVEFTKPEALKF